MQTFRLAQVAAEAEMLRLKRLVSRTAMRAVFGLVALIFFTAFLVGVHVLIAIWLLPHLGAMYATLIVLAGDLVLAIGFGALAATSAVSKVEREALEIREAARMKLVEQASVAAMIAPMAKLMGNRSIFRVAVATLIAKMFTTAARR